LAPKEIRIMDDKHDLLGETKYWPNPHTVKNPIPFRSTNVNVYQRQRSTRLHLPGIKQKIVPDIRN
jgi:hypothetical protein